MKIKPCLCCGKHGKVIYEKDEDYMKYLYVTCIDFNNINRTHCLRTNFFYYLNNKESKEKALKKAIEAWNTRVSPWIKCEDGLPEDCRLCIAISRNESYHQCYYSNTYNEWLDGKRFIHDVIAWMPIPEFKERGE